MKDKIIQYIQEAETDKHKFGYAGAYGRLCGALCTAFNIKLEKIQTSGDTNGKSREGKN